MSIHRWLLSTSLLIGGCALDTDPAAGNTTAASPTSQRALDLLASRRAALGLSADHTFSVRRELVDELGQAHVRVDQLYRGVPVVGGSATISPDAPAERAITDGLVRGIDLDVRPKLTASQARAAAEAVIVPGTYRGEPRITLQILPSHERVVRATGLPAGHQAINATALDNNVTGARLVYRVETSEREGHRELATLVDANTGEIVSVGELGEHFTGTAKTFFSGTVSITTDGPADDGKPFQLEDPARDDSRVWDEPVNSGVPFSDGNDVFGDGQSFNPFTSRQTAGADAYFGVEVAWNMFEHVLGYDGVDGDGLFIHVGVHDPDQFDNGLFSAWDHDIYVGDSDLIGGAMTSLDLIGHEYGHAIVNKTANWGNSGEDGALNEGDSDIWGAISRIYFKHASDQSKAPTGNVVPVATSLTNDWTHDIDLGGTERKLFDPKVRYFTSDIGDLDPHDGLGPISRMFFFLAQGSDPHVISPTWSHSLQWGMTGLGNDAAARIWFRSVRVYGQDGDGYAEARDHTIDAVRDLFGTFGTQEKAVRNAFAGVDVGDPAVNAPDAPLLVLDAGDGHNTEDTAQVLTPAAGAVAGLKKVNVFGEGTVKDDYKITIPCSSSVGLRVESSGHYTLAIFRGSDTTATDSAAGDAGIDLVAQAPAQTCKGKQDWFIRVLSQSDNSFPFYTLHIDEQD